MKDLCRIGMLLGVVFLAGAFGTGGKKLFDGKTLKGWVCDPEEEASHWQLHQGVHMAVQFKNITITEL